MRSAFYWLAVGMAQVYTVTASTSIVLVNSIVAPNTVVLLSSIQYPGHIIGVRDTTGSSQIAQYPVIISTMRGLKFYDGTSSILINQPNGYLSFSSRDAFTWQLLNSVGFLTTLSTGFVQSLTAQRVFATTLSTPDAYISSMTVANVNISKSFEVLGNTDIEGDIGIGGSLNVFSSLHAFQSLTLSSGLTVGGNVAFLSSLFIKDTLTIGSNLSTLQNLVVGNDLQIDTSLYVVGALLPSNLSVQTLTVDTLQLGGGFQLAGAISTTNLFTASSLTALGRGMFENAVTISTMTAVVSSLSVDGQLVTSSLRVGGDASIFQNGNASTLAASGGLSTLQTATIQGEARILGQGLVYGPLYVKEATFLETLDVVGTATISSLRVSTLDTMGFLSSYGSTFTVRSDLNIRSTLAVGIDLIAGFRGDPFTNAYFSTPSYLSSLAVESSLIISTVLGVTDNAWVGGNMESITTLDVGSNVSTTFLTVKGQVFVTGETNVKQTLIVTTLGAPIRLNISTLVLSNTLFVDTATIPSLETDFFTGNIAVGQDFTGVDSYNLYVDGILQNRDLVTQSIGNDFSKVWTANSLRASTIQGYSNISTTVLGPTTFSYPIGLPSTGVLIGGQPLNAATESIYFANNVLSQFYGTKPLTSLVNIIPKRIRYNGVNRWVAVGQGVGGPSGINAMYSTDGYNWNAGSGIATGTVLNDLAYGNGRWVAVGSNPSGIPNIYSSADGITWSGGTNTFTPAGPSLGYGLGVAYNGSLWLAVGLQANVSAVKYSADGITWINGNLPIPLSGPLTSVVWTGTTWYTYSRPISGASYLFQSLNGVSWTLVGTNATVNVDYMSYTPLTNTFVCVGSNRAGNPQTTISFGNTGGTPLNLTPSGIFTAAATDVYYDSNRSFWYVSGYNINGIGANLAVSPNLSSWIPLQTFQGSNLTVTAGTIQVPAILPYFTANMTSIFHSTLSSQTMFASTVNASSFQGTFFGDGTLLTNVTRFSENLFVSSIRVSTIQTKELSTSIAVINNTSTMDTITVNKVSFFSSGNIFLAAGNDYIPQGSIKISQNANTWAQAFTSSFTTYGNAITGTKNLTNPFFVAVGADTRQDHTIQYSENGFVWNPVQTGGFAYQTEEGIREAKSVAYDSVLEKWAAVGVSLGNTATIQYSDDGISWYDATNGFTDSGTTVVASPYPTSATRFVAIGSEGIKWSQDGETWFNASVSLANVVFTAIAAGKYGFPASRDGWVAIDTQNRVFVSSDESATVFLYNSGQETQAPVSDLLWLGTDTNWIAIGSNALQRSVTGISFTLSNTLNVLSLNKIIYNDALGVYVIGARGSNQDLTILNSSNLETWGGVAAGSGFSTTVVNFAQGYGVASLGNTLFAVGNSALTVQGRVRPSILKLNYTDAGTWVTEVSLTASNASNLFTNAVRGIAASSDEPNKYVVVGDAVTPQKTIARSPDGSQGSWIPAITGGFSTTGYGVTYLNGNWIAVGDAQSSSNVIQYSPDGANWFGTNNCPGIRSGGRGIASGALEGSPGSNIVVAVGKDTTTSTIVYSSNGFNWSNATSGYFNTQGNGVAVGYNATGPMIVAVGQDTRGGVYSLLKSTDAASWTTGGTSVLFGSQGGFGVTFTPGKFVAVGDANVNGATILYADCNAAFWSEAVNGFTAAGYGVTYNTASNLFFAVGKDSNGDAPLTIKYSGDGATWSNFSTGYGFVSQKELGSANGLFTQAVAATESFPYMNFCNLVVYDRESPILYPHPTIRVSTSLISLTEGLFVRSSLQASVGVDVTYGTNALSVDPFVTYVPHLIYRGPPYISTLAEFSTIQISSLVTNQTGIGIHLQNPITTPLLAINPPSSFADQPPSGESSNYINKYLHTKANDITTLFNATRYNLFVNDTLQINTGNDEGMLNPPGGSFASQIYLGEKPFNSVLFNGTAEVNLQGTFATSTLSTSYCYIGSNLYISTSQIYFNDQYLKIYEGITKPTLENGFTIQTTPSSITFHDIMTLQVSTQKVGVFTSNPQFELDVRGYSFLTQPVQTIKTNASLLSLQIQSF